MFSNKAKQENESLRQQLIVCQKQIAELQLQNSALSNRIVEAGGGEILNLMPQLAQIRENISQKSAEISSLNQVIANLEKEIADKRAQLVSFEESVLLEEFAVYKKQYPFENSQAYMTQISAIVAQQKEMVKRKTAATGSQSWSVNGNLSLGRKMVQDMIKLLLRAFNNECDECISKVKFNNVESCSKRICKTYESINNLGSVNQVRISSAYFQNRLRELYLTHEYRVMKEKEKEEQRAMREQLREEARLAKEIELARKDLLKEKKHYANALEKLNGQLAACTSDETRGAIEGKISDVQSRLEEISKESATLDYREANKRAGYVYVISNIGSFGEGVYKIGMTRRLDPTERVDELGDASVPFTFDTHAMIFSEDAPALENALHKAFDSKKVNLINHRREFFRVSLPEVERVIRENHDKSVEVVGTHLAEQYRLSEKMRGEA